MVSGVFSHTQTFCGGTGLKGWLVINKGREAESLGLGVQKAWSVFSPTHRSDTGCRAQGALMSVFACAHAYTHVSVYRRKKTTEVKLFSFGSLIGLPDSLLATP